MFSKDLKKFYITTAIDYVNSSPHIGTAYEKIASDVLARFHRMLGERVHFQMGNDEHSINVKKAADAQGIGVAEYCLNMEKKFIEAWKNLNIDYDGFIRTSSPAHHTSVQKIIQKILDTGDIYKSSYKGWYCESCEAFLTDKDLVDKKCPNHKTEPKWVEEENYFFKLSKYQNRLLKHIKDNPEFILPAVRRNEVVKMIEMGLNDISASRASEWGIPLPHDPRHVAYVWIDALTNYITAVGYGTDEKNFKKWWPADLHVIGKDIIRFHCVIWPAMLMSAGLALPKSIFAHGFVYLKGEKMSKSLGNVVTPLDITNDFGEDPLRYYLLREVPFGKDADFTWEHFIERYNGELANGIGNLISRTVGMVHRYLEGIVPASEPVKNAMDKEFRDSLSVVPGAVHEALKIQDGGIFFNNALASIWEGIAAADRYINENKPWELQKNGDVQRIKTVISNVAEAIGIITPLLYSFMPKTSQKIWKQFGFEKFKNLEDIKFDHVKWGMLSTSVKIAPLASLFPRIEEKKEKVTEVTKETKMEFKENLIDISEFAKVELKVAEVMKAEKVEGADKLLKLEVSLGDETRQIVAGIARAYSPEELVGKKIAMVTNLKPAKLRGIESQGMLLAASNGDTVSILTPLKDIPAGSKIK